MDCCIGIKFKNSCEGCESYDDSEDSDEYDEAYETFEEIQQLEKDLEGEIDLLWLTGELRLERPSLEAEIEWGLQFYKTSIIRLFKHFAYLQL